MVYLVIPQHLKERNNYELHSSSSCSDDELKETETRETSETETVVQPEEEQSPIRKLQIKLTTPTETEHDLLLSPTTSQSVPTSPIFQRHQIPIPEAVSNSSDDEESGMESIAMMRQRSCSVEILTQVDSEDEKQADPNNPPTQGSIKSRVFSRFKTGIANKLKTNRFFGDSVTPSVPTESESSSKPSPILALRKTVTSLKDKTQHLKAVKRKTKTTMISI